MQLVEAAIDRFTLATREQLQAALEERDQAIRVIDALRRELELARQATIADPQTNFSSSSDVTVPMDPKDAIKAGFNPDSHAIYAKHSETFAAMHEPWTNSQLLESKERIAKELLASALILQDGPEKAELIEAAASLGFPAACFYHYRGISRSKYGFTRDEKILPQLRDQYSDVKLKSLQRDLHAGDLDSLQGSPEAYVDRLIKLADNGSELAIYRYLRILHLNSKDLSGLLFEYFKAAEKVKMHPDIITATKDYITRGSEVALAWMFIISPTPQCQAVHPGHKFRAYQADFPFDVVKKYCTNSVPFMMQTKTFRYLKLMDSTQRRSWWNCLNGPVYVVNPDTQHTEDIKLQLEHSFNKTFRSYADQGDEVARRLLLYVSNPMDRKIHIALQGDPIVVRAAITGLAREGCRVGQQLQIYSVLGGLHGFEKDEKAARSLMLEYNIFRFTEEDAYEARLDYGNEQSGFLNSAHMENHLICSGWEIF